MQLTRRVAYRSRALLAGTWEAQRARRPRPRTHVREVLTAATTSSKIATRLAGSARRDGRTVGSRNRITAARCGRSHVQGTASLDPGHPAAGKPDTSLAAGRFTLPSVAGSGWRPGAVR